jgi:hypothetical protein
MMLLSLSLWNDGLEDSNRLFVSAIQWHGVVVTVFGVKVSLFFGESSVICQLKHMLIIQTPHTDNGASDGDTMQFLTLLPQTIPFLVYNIYFLIRL